MSKKLSLFSYLFSNQPVKSLVESEVRKTIMTMNLPGKI